jgi:hypothetical protein
MSDVYSSLSFLIQVIKIPKTLVLPSAESVIFYSTLCYIRVQVLHRMVFDLNLPPGIWERIRVILSLLPPIKQEWDIEKLQYPCEFFTGQQMIDKLMRFRKRFLYLFIQTTPFQAI